MNWNPSSGNGNRQLLPANFSDVTKCLWNKPDATDDAAGIEHHLFTPPHTHTVYLPHHFVSFNTHYICGYTVDTFCESLIIASDNFSLSLSLIHCFRVVVAWSKRSKMCNWHCFSLTNFSFFFFYSFYVSGSFHFESVSWCFKLHQICVWKVAFDYLHLGQMLISRLLGFDGQQMTLGIC